MRTSVAHREVMDGSARVHWLAEIEVAGHTFRVADEDLEVEDDNGLTWRYEAGLEDLEHQVGLEGISATSLTVGTNAAGEEGGWPALLARATIPRPPWGGRARLLRWVEGQVLDEARVLIDGVIRGGDHGDALAPLTVEVEYATAVRTLVPPEDAQIDARTWPSSASYQSDERALGATYPLPIGAPGGSATWGAAAIAAHASPAYLADYCGGAHLYGNCKIVIAYVPDGTTLVDTTVSLMDASGGSAAPGGIDGAWTIDPAMTILYGSDLLGRRVAYVSPAAWTGWGTTIRFEPGGEYYVKFTNGGVYNTERTGALRKAGEVISTLLTWGNVPVASGRMQAARGRLDRYLIDCTLSDSSDMERFVAGELAAILPIVKRTCADGVWYELLRYDAQTEDAVLHLVVPELNTEAFGYVEFEEEFGPSVAIVSRESGPKWEPDWDDIANEVTVNYSPTRGSELTRRAVVTGGTPAAQTSYALAELGSAICAASRTLYGERQAKPVDIPWLHDDATAMMIAQEIAMRRAIPRRIVSVRGDVADLEVLEPGDVVRVTDREIGLRGALALVRTCVLGLDQVEIEVEALDHLALISPWAPEELPIAEAYGDAAAIFDAHVVLATAGVATQVTDQSGNGSHATVVTGTAPTWTSSYAPFGGKPALVFAGAGSIATTATFAQDDLTLVVAFYDPGVTGSWESPVGFSYTVNISWFRDNATDPNEWTIGVIEPGAPYGQVVTAADGVPHVVVLRRRGSNHSVWVDGVKAAEKTGSSATTTATTMKLGTAPSGANFGGALAFAGLWSRAFTDAEIESITNRLWKGHLGQLGDL